MSIPAHTVKLTLDFESFYTGEYPNVVRLAFLLSGSWAVAEDVAQDAFIACFTRWEHVSRLDSPEGWVRRVTANAVTSRWRRLQTELRHRHRLVERDAVEDRTSDDAVWAALRRLPRRQAQALALRFLYGFGPTEIAGILECSIDTAKTHLSRGRRAMAAALKEIPE